LLERDTRAAALFEVQVGADAGGFARVRWSKREAWHQWARLSEGCYLLRSNVTDWNAEDLWRAYIQLTECIAPDFLDSFFDYRHAAASRASSL
jgi:hypothetical protein